MAEDEGIHKRQGYFLPHWTQKHGVYHVVFRLRDSLPQNVLKCFREEARKVDILDLTPEGLSQAHLNERIEAYLDAGHGECLLGRPAIAELVVGTLHHFDSVRYGLYAWAVMPNHVHTIVQPQDGHELERILHSWKSFSATTINSMLGRSGEFWQKESYDRLIRSESEFNAQVEYVLRNPRIANLPDWKWVGRHSDFKNMVRKRFG